MRDIYKYIEIYDEIINTIKEYQFKKQKHQIMVISIINNDNNIIVDIGLKDLNNNTIDIRTKVLDLSFNKYVLPRIVLRYNNWYQIGKEQLVEKQDERTDYINISTIGDTLKLINYNIDTINYIRCLID